ncbi:MAG TPA: GNAT family N-acetyltransferase [Acidimicrobiales bacterium]
MPDIAAHEPPPADVLDAYRAAGRAWVVTANAGRAGAPVGEIAGYVLVDVLDAPGGGPGGSLHVEQVSVDPAFARRGLGRRLIDHAAADARRRGFAALTLTTFRDVPWNAPYYERLGFRPLAEHELGPDLRRILDSESAHGLDPAQRVCMRRDLAGSRAQSEDDCAGEAGGAAPVELLTVGHGTLAADDLAALLRDHGVELVVDVRSYPGSRRHPQFGREQMAAWLPEAGIDYRWEPRLGGRRRAQGDSPNVALRNPAFRGYADHMGGADFRAGLDGVLAEARRRRTAVLCSESVWWRCHRRLLSDAAVLVRGATVRHLMHDGRTAPHRPTEGVRRAGDRVVYDVGGDRPLPL